MYFLSWIIVGLITGWLTGKLVREGGYGPILNIVMGVAGAVAGGFVALLASSPNYSGLAYTSLQRFWAPRSSRGSTLMPATESDTPDITSSLLPANR